MEAYSQGMFLMCVRSGLPFCLCCQRISWFVSRGGFSFFSFFLLLLFRFVGTDWGNHGQLNAANIPAGSTRELTSFPWEVSAGLAAG